MNENTNGQFGLFSIDGATDEDGKLWILTSSSLPNNWSCVTLVLYIYIYIYIYIYPHKNINGQIITATYHKPTDTQQYFHSNSPPPKKKKNKLYKIHPLHSST